MAEIVVVVGATGAFGSAIVDHVVAAGYQVVAVGRHTDALERLRKRHGAALLPCPADLTDDAAIGSIHSAVAQCPDPVRALVHGPGLVGGGGIGEIEPSALAAAVDLKVGGLLRAVRAVDSRLRPGSRIIAIAGHYGLEPTEYAAAPGIANAALINAVRQLSLAYGPRGITAHTIAPGPADTPRLRAIAAERAAREGVSVEVSIDQMLADSSIGALVTPEQVAWAVGTLLAPEAAAMTGSTLMLDAGRRRGLP